MHTDVRKRAWQGHLSAILALTDDFSGGRLRRRVCLRDGQANRVSSEASALLFAQYNNFEVRWFLYVEEELWVAAPVLILAAPLVNTSATSSVFLPFASIVLPHFRRG